MPQPAEPGRASRRARASALIVALVAAGCGGHGGVGVSEGAAEDAPSATDAARAADPGSPVLERQESGTTALLQAVSAVSEQVVWVSGHEGTWGRTTDGGETWTTNVVPDADTLQFRDVHAESADLAWLLAAGPGDMSRIYRTDDGGATWRLQWTNDEPDGFYDCLDFWSDERGAVYGDAVDGELRVLRTVDGGGTWTRLAGDALPRALLNEGGFAASGTCLVAGPGGRGWIATGNASEARVLRTDDWGASWTAFDTPVPGGEGAGLFSIAFRDSLHGVIFGGSLAPPPTDEGRGAGEGGAAAGGADSAAVREAAPRVAVSDDGGASWWRAGRPGPGGPIFGGAWVPGTEPAAMVAVAPTGAAWSGDGGDTWLALDGAAYWGLGFATNAVGWMVGPGGRVTKVSFR